MTYAVSETLLEPGGINRLTNLVAAQVLIEKAEFIGQPQRKGDCMLVMTRSSDTEYGELFATRLDKHAPNKWDLPSSCGGATRSWPYARWGDDSAKTLETAREIVHACTQDDILATCLGLRFSKSFLEHTSFDQVIIIDVNHVKGWAKNASKDPGYREQIKEMRVRRSRARKEEEIKKAQEQEAQAMKKKQKFTDVQAQIIDELQHRGYQAKEIAVAMGIDDTRRVAAWCTVGHRRGKLRHRGVRRPGSPDITHKISTMAELNAFLKGSAKVKIPDSVQDSTPQTVSKSSAAKGSRRRYKDFELEVINQSTHLGYSHPQIAKALDRTASGALSDRVKAAKKKAPPVFASSGLPDLPRITCHKDWDDFLSQHDHLLEVVTGGDHAKPKPDKQTTWERQEHTVTVKATDNPQAKPATASTVLAAAKRSDMAIYDTLVAEAGRLADAHRKQLMQLPNGFERCLESQALMRVDALVKILA